MKYLCLVYLEEEKLRAVPDRECMACGDGFRKSGLLVAAEALQPVRDGNDRPRPERESVDHRGPFAETKRATRRFLPDRSADLNDAIHGLRRFHRARGKH